MVYQFVSILKIDKTCDNIGKLIKDIGSSFLIS